MKRIVLCGPVWIAVAVWLTVSVAGAAEPASKRTTGTLKGQFVYDGVPPKPRVFEAPPLVTHEGRPLGGRGDDLREKYEVVDESLVVGEEGGLKNAFIWIRSKDVPVEGVDKLEPVTITFKEGRFTPHAIALRAPRELILKNDEALKVATTFHYLGSKVLEFHAFVKPNEQSRVSVQPESSPVHIRSEIQKWASAWVLPLGHPYVAVSDAKGGFRIEGLPLGKWEFQVWHERTESLKLKDWLKGRFTMEIKGEDHDLGTIKVPRDLFK